MNYASSHTTRVEIHLRCDWMRRITIVFILHRFHSYKKKRRIRDMKTQTHRIEWKSWSISCNIVSKKRHISNVELYFGVPFSLSLSLHLYKSAEPMHWYNNNNNKTLNMFEWNSMRSMHKLRNARFSHAGYFCDVSTILWGNILGFWHERHPYHFACISWDSLGIIPQKDVSTCIDKSNLCILPFLLPVIS